MTINASQTTLLNYAIDTVPDPLQQSPANGDPVLGTLTLIISNGNPNKVINLFSLTVSIPCGTTAHDLTNNPSAIMISVDPERKWNISTTTTAGYYIIQPASGQYIALAETGVVFQFFNIPINQQPGTVTINIGEYASTTTTAPAVPAFASPQVAKFPYGFFFSNLVANVPMVRVNNSVTLTWQGSTQAKYFMLYNDQQVDVSNLRKWTSPPLTVDTTFLLKAVSESNGNTVESGLSTTVIVANPYLVADTLQVNHDTQLNGQVSINADSLQTGNSRLDGNALVNGDMTVTSNLNVEGGVRGFDGNFTYLNCIGVLKSPSTESGLIQCQTGYFSNIIIGWMQSKITSVDWWSAQSNDQNDLLLTFNGQVIFTITPSGMVTVTPYQGVLPSPCPEYTPGMDADAWKVPAGDQQQ